MTELIGGSDVAQTETVARRDGDNVGDSTAPSGSPPRPTADMALTLARPEGNPPGGRGLAMFYLELRDEQRAASEPPHQPAQRQASEPASCRPRSSHLDGVEAVPVAGLENGVRNITPMLNITRTWNAVGAILGMQRAVALTRDYAKQA